MTCNVRCTGDQLGAGMSATRDETAPGRGGNGDGLPGPATNAATQAALGDITPRWQANARSLACGKTLPMSGTRNMLAEQADGPGSCFVPVPTGREDFAE